MGSPGKRSACNGVHAGFRSRPMLLLLCLAFLPGSVAGDGGLPPGPGTRGVQVTREVPFASETLGSIRAADTARSPRAREDRSIPRHRIDRGSATGAPGMPRALHEEPAFPSSVPAAASVAPAAPALERSFPGLGNPPPGQDVIPPDTMGAAGPSHLVSLLNSEFGVFDKSSGAILQRADLQTFWASLGAAPGEPADFPFDTKVLWDQHGARFVAVTLGGTSAGSSYVMIAVSSSSDPTGTWNKWAIPSSPDNTVWADYPGFGLDAYNIYITANMFNNNDDYQYSKIWVIPKAQLLTVPQSGSIIWWPFETTSGSSLQPAHTFGASNSQYLVFEDQFINATSLLLAKIDNVTGNPVWNPPVRVGLITPYTADSFLPGAPQAGDSRTIDTSDTRLLNAVFRNGYVWTTHTVAVNGKTEVAWYRINPVTGTVASQGRISDTLRWYYYPSIAVNQDNVAAIGFSGSSTIEYAGGYYTILRPTLQPPFYAAEPVALLKSGDAPYYKTLSKLDNRWGDFSATVVDPADDVTFWTLQEYAKVPVLSGSTLVSQWGTWWGKFRPSGVAAPAGLTATASPLPQVVLNWTDASGNETGFKVERRRLPGQDYAVVASLNQNVTTFTDNAATGLLGGFTYSYRVQAYIGAEGSYSAEAFASTAAPPPPPSSDGGGGCLSITPSAGTTADASSVLSLLILFLPAAVSGWKRLFRPGNP